MSNFLEFHEWKQKVKRQGFIKPKDWYWKYYGRYCSNVRANRWVKTKTLPEEQLNGKQ